VILGTTVLDFILVNKMDKAKNDLHRKLLLSISVTINLSLLFYFKYSNFFIENLNSALVAFGLSPISWMRLVLPIGISFYTFETITYVVDVYRRVHKPQPDFWNYQLYIIFFPKLIAGPIIRYHEFANQIKERYYSTGFQNSLAGFVRFSIGLGKKVLLANACGGLADQILSFDFSAMSSPVAWLGIIAYTMQIYFDFSGYSDMAIGLGRMMGFLIPENFNNPYTSRSITEFWRRWHITLGSWMRNYLYIPLGGNKVRSKGRLYLNLIFVFLASGLWHGASWNFIFWGAYHGFFLVLERAFLLKRYEKMSPYFTIPLNFIIVMVGWVFFRLESFTEASLFVSRLFAFKFGNWPFIDYSSILYLIIALLFAFINLTKVGRSLETAIYNPSGEFLSRPAALIVLSGFLFILSVAVISSAGFNPFIYFRF
jgi:alginate O-acetyltransferase complex protein AlgI